jgi:hypothetical protein
MKRLNYFKHQFLEERDFQDEQRYHIEMRRRHNRALHSWGIAEGLQVTQRGEREITIGPGMAIDHEGREIMLTADLVHDLSAFRHLAEVWVSIAYHEEHQAADRDLNSGVERYTRTTETFKIDSTKEQPLREGSVIILARVEFDDTGHIAKIDTSERKPTRQIVEILDEKRESRPDRRDLVGFTGWMRMPFKPVKLDKRLNVRPPIGGESDEGIFSVGIEYAYCGQRGARGTMGIPVPPGARKIKGFRIAGNTNGKVTVRLLRTGWVRDEPDSFELLLEIIEGPSFHKHVRLDADLDPEGNALAVSVEAEGAAEIWLVATEF